MTLKGVVSQDTRHVSFEIGRKISREVEALQQITRQCKNLMTIETFIISDNSRLVIAYEHVHNTAQSVHTINRYNPRKRLGSLHSLPITESQLVHTKQEWPQSSTESTFEFIQQPHSERKNDAVDLENQKPNKTKRKPMPKQKKRKREEEEL